MSQRRKNTAEFVEHLCKCLKCPSACKKKGKCFFFFCSLIVSNENLFITGSFCDGNKRLSDILREKTMFFYEFFNHVVC